MRDLDTLEMNEIKRNLLRDKQVLIHYIFMEQGFDNHSLLQASNADYTSRYERCITVTLPKIQKALGGVTKLYAKHVLSELEGHLKGAVDSMFLFEFILIKDDFAKFTVTQSAVDLMSKLQSVSSVEYSFKGKHTHALLMYLADMFKDANVVECSVDDIVGVLGLSGSYANSAAQIRDKIISVALAEINDSVIKIESTVKTEKAAKGRPSIVGFIFEKKNYLRAMFESTVAFKINNELIDYTLIN